MRPSVDTILMLIDSISPYNGIWNGFIIFRGSYGFYLFSFNLILSVILFMS